MGVLERLELMGDGEAIYFCGNSLGLLNKRAKEHMLEEMDQWATGWACFFPTGSNASAVTGHFQHKYNRPWKYLANPMLPVYAKILGAKESELAHSSTLKLSSPNEIESLLISPIRHSSTLTAVRYHRPVGRTQ